MITVTATDIQNNFGRYLQMVHDGKEIIIIKNGKEIARLISAKQSVSFLTDSLIGVLKNDYDEKSIKDEKIARYENIN